MFYNKLNSVMNRCLSLSTCSLYWVISSATIETERAGVLVSMALVPGTLSSSLLDFTRSRWLGIAGLGYEAGDTLQDKLQ